MYYILTYSLNEVDSIFRITQKSGDDKIKDLLKILSIYIIMTSLSSAEILNIPSEKYQTIQAGIDSAIIGDTVLVNVGTYNECINFNGKNIIVGSLILTTGNMLYISQTIIEGNGDGSVVTFENDEDSTSVLNGFTVKGGLSAKGGGIYCINSSPTLINLCVTRNRADDFLTWPSGQGRGGGIYFNNSNSYLYNVELINNSADGSFCSGGYCGVGGGIFIDNSSNLYLEDIIINKNRAGDGAGICCADSSYVYFKNLTVNSNTCVGPDLTIGAGIACSAYSTMYIERAIIYQNKTDSFGFGGGISCSDSKLYLNHITLTGNSSSMGGGIGCSRSNVILTNSIIFNNSPNEIEGSSSNIIFAYSNIPDSIGELLINEEGMVFWLKGNFYSDPLFVDSLGDFNLKLDSPCIDTGTQDTILLYNDENDTLIIPPSDFNWYAPDIGALESQYFSTITEKEYILENFKVDQNYPNPFNPSTTIEFVLPKATDVRIEVYNSIGQKFQTLLNKKMSAGTHQVEFNAGNLSSGVYFYRTEAGEFQDVKKMVLLR